MKLACRFIRASWGTQFPSALHARMYGSVRNSITLNRGSLRPAVTSIQNVGPSRGFSSHGENRTLHSHATHRNGTTHTNWARRLPEFLNAIRDSDFVAFDIELTGLHSRSERFVGLERCYEAHCDGAQNFVPVQIGLCPAKLLPSDSQESDRIWQLAPISIYVSPKTEGIFQVSTSALKFLKNNNFDFNEWIANGVGTMRIKEELERRSLVGSRITEIERMKASLNTASAVRLNKEAAAPKPPIDIQDEKDKKVVEEVRRQIKEWLDNSSQPSSFDPEGQPMNATTNNFHLEIPMENAFQRLLLHSVIAHEFPEVYSHSSKRGDTRMLCIYRSQTEVYDEQLDALTDELNSIDEMIGIRALFDAITEHKKVLVGHNCFYDSLHLYQSLYDELPDNVHEFKKQWTSRFHLTFDTKHLAESHEQLSALQSPATLKGLCDFMVAVTAATQSPNVQPNVKPMTLSLQSLDDTHWRLPPAYTPLLSIYRTKKVKGHDVNKSVGISRSEEMSDLSHEAGFDALLTSILFLTQTNHILNSKQIDWARIHFRPKNSQSDRDMTSIMDVIPSMANRIRLVKTQPNVIDLSGREEADMTRYLFMTGFPSSWKKWEVMKIWSPVWITPSWVDAQSCWIVAKSDEDVQNIRMIYSLMDPPLFKLYTYEQYKEMKKHEERSS